MISLDLSLQYCDRPQHTPAAWFLPGGDPQVWLAELAAWPVPHAEVKLLPVATSPADHRLAGLLAISAAGDAKPPSPRWVAYGCLAARLYLPVHATLNPELTPAELSTLLGDDITYVWHPLAGLVGFEPGDVRRIADLLRVEPPRENNWDAAQPGLAFCSELRSIAPQQQLSVESIFQQGRDDIGRDADGQDPDELNDLPPSPQEPAADPISRTARGAQRAIARATKWLANRMPAATAGASWGTTLANWADQQLKRLSPHLESARHRNLERLMRMLESDPDRGLRYAIPFSSGQSSRGVAPPSSNLSARNVDFNLSRLGGGGPADYWQINYQQQMRLQARYRELANRELRLGRHRRAAYIFAELLGDLPAAAGALREGRHWREAAVLYGDRLHQPLEAAQCLAEGGLWSEAIELYETLGEFERAGDLCTQIEQIGEAEAFYLRSVDIKLLQDDRLDAARLLDEKLHAADEAIEVLIGGWPSSGQALECLRRSFTLWSRLGRHDEAARMVERVRNEDLWPERMIAAATLLSRQASDYPHEATKAQAADAVRAIASRMLATPPHRNEELLAAVRGLVPSDRLLARDCNRFRTATRPPRPAYRVQPKRDVLRLVRIIELPVDVHWQQWLGVGKGIFAAGVQHGRLRLARSNWAGQIDFPQQRKMPRVPADMQTRITADPRIGYEAPRSTYRLVMGNSLDGHPISLDFPITDAFPQRCTVRRWPGLADARVMCGFSLSKANVLWCIELQTDNLVLTGIDELGQRIATHDVTKSAMDSMHSHSEENPDPSNLIVHTSGEQVYVVCGMSLSVYGKQPHPTVMQLNEPIFSIASTPCSTRRRLAVTFARGAAIYWDGFDRSEPQRFATDLEKPVVGFNRGGHVLAAASEGVEVYAMQNERVQIKAVFPRLPAEPIAVLSGLKTNQFGIGLANGKLLVLEIP